MDLSQTFHRGTNEPSVRRAVMVRYINKLCVYNRVGWPAKI